MRSLIFRTLKIHHKSFTITMLTLYLCISIQSCSSYERSEESQDYLSDPKVGDVYFIELDDQVFTLYKIHAIEHDQIVFKTNKGKCKPDQFMDESDGHIKFVRTGDLDIPFLWSDSNLTMTKNAIKKSYENNTIFEIKRN